MVRLLGDVDRGVSRSPGAVPVFQGVIEINKSLLNDVDSERWAGGGGVHDEVAMAPDNNS